MPRKELMSELEIKDVLKKYYPNFEAGLVDEIASIASIKNLADGDIIMRTGQYIKSTVLVIEGAIKVYREGADGEEYFMYEIETGGACALSIICAARSLTSELKGVVSRPSRVILIPTDKLDELTHKYKTWYQFVLETYRKRFEELIQVVENIAFKNMDERLEFYLQEKSKNYHTKSIEITHQEIAHDLNSSREVISRLLKKMENMGMVKLERSHIQLLK